MTTAVSTRTISDDALEALRAQLHGPAVRPTDAGYEDVRATFNAMHAGRPDVAIRCMGAADVVAGVNFARDQGLDLTVRGGGHSIAGLSAHESGVLLDLAAMRGVQVDPVRRLAARAGRRAVERRRPRDAGVRARRPRRRRLRYRRCRPHARRRLRLGPAQVRALRRQPRRGAGRVRRRRDPHRFEGLQPRPVLGDPRRRRQLRRRDVVHVPAARARARRRVLGDVLPARRGRARSCAAGASTPRAPRTR